MYLFMRLLNNILRIMQFFMTQKLTFDGFVQIRRVADLLRSYYDSRQKLIKRNGCFEWAVFLCFQGSR